MKKNNVFFILLCCLLYSKIAMAHYTDESKSISKTFMAKDAKPDTWLKLGTLDIGTASTLFNSIAPCTPVPTSFLCTAGTINLGYNGKAGYILYLSRKESTISDGAGNNYMIKIAFDGNPPRVGLYEHNNQGGRVWNVTAFLDNTLSSPSDYANVATAIGDAQGYCGNINGCQYLIGSYIHENSGMPSVYFKIPKNISTRTIVFKDIEVLELKLNISNRNNDVVTPTSARLYLSGTISVPQRCYIKVDENNFDFGTIYSNEKNGSVKDVSTSITTDCYYAPVGTVQYLKMEAVSGGSLNDKKTIYQVGSDSALGVVFNINNHSQCEPNTIERNIFKQEYLIRKVLTLQQQQFSTDTINFSLCKYGVPSITGQKNVVLKLTSRWVID